MQFIFHPNAGENTLKLEGDSYTHLYKSRRTRKIQTLKLRNLLDDYLYLYDQTFITRSNATLQLKEKILSPNRSSQKTHIILAVINFKTIQKILPFLNELGVKKLTLFYADFSQKNEKIDHQKLQAILINSSQQCGRSDIMKVDVLNHLKDVIQAYPQINVLDFGGEIFHSSIASIPILIGPEGGFSTQEKEFLKKFPTYSAQENIILRSETACIFVASKLHS